MALDGKKLLAHASLDRDWVIGERRAEIARLSAEIERLMAIRSAIEATLETKEEAGPLT